MNVNTAIDYAWVATRSKALLTTQDRARLTAGRGVYANPMNADPHLAAAIDALLAP